MMGQNEEKKRSPVPFVLAVVLVIWVVVYLAVNSGTPSREATGRRPADRPHQPTSLAVAERPSQPEEAPAATVSPSPALPPAPSTHGEPTLPDVFGALRMASESTARYEPSWRELASAIEKLGTLEGASVDARTGQLILYGTEAKEKGPFQIEDILVALQAAFQELEPVGMTLDEDPDNKLGPWMLAKFFAGTRDTHFGQVMFECDRLMKCLAQGEDNVTKAELRPKIAGFVTQTDITLASGEKPDGAVWNRYWANLTTGRFPESDLRGKPLVEVSSDKHTISFAAHSIYVDTEQMLDPGKGVRLVSTGGKQSASALAFANQMTTKYTELAREFPAFQALQELSKLVVLAEWIRDAAMPIDPELLHCRASSGTTTPTKTPSLATSNALRQGNAVLHVQAFGGVTLAPKTKYVQTKEKRADALAVVVEKQRSELRTGTVVTETGPDSRSFHLIPFGPSERGPPEMRAPSRCTEVQKSLRRQERQPTDPVLGPRELPVFTDRATGEDMQNFPVLRIDFSPRRTQTVKLSLSDGSLNEQIQVPERLYLTSPGRDIHIEFETDPTIDRQRPGAEVYFPAKAKGVRGYYPKSRTVRMDDGTAYQFNATDGTVAAVELPEGLRLVFKHQGEQDGSLYFKTVANGNSSSQGPPGDHAPYRQLGMQNRRTMASPAQDVPGPDAKTIATVENRETGKTMEVRQDNGRIYYVYALN